MGCTRVPLEYVSELRRRRGVRTIAASSTSHSSGNARENGKDCSHSTKEDERAKDNRPRFRKPTRSIFGEAWQRSRCSPAAAVLTRTASHGSAPTARLVKCLIHRPTNEMRKDRGDDDHTAVRQKKGESKLYLNTQFWQTAG